MANSSSLDLNQLQSMLERPGFYTYEITEQMNNEALSIQDVLNQVENDQDTQSQYDTPWELFENRLSAYHSELSKLVPACELSARCSDENPIQACISSIKKLALRPAPSTIDLAVTGLDQTRLYPALLLFYATGIGAIREKSWGNILKLFYSRIDSGEELLGQQRDHASTLLNQDSVLAGLYYQREPDSDAYAGKRITEFIETSLSELLSHTGVSNLSGLIDLFEGLIAIFSRTDHSNVPTYGRLFTSDEEHFLPRLESTLEDIMKIIEGNEEFRIQMPSSADIQKAFLELKTEMRVG